MGRGALCTVAMKTAIKENEMLCRSEQMSITPRNGPRTAHVLFLIQSPSPKPRNIDFAAIRQCQYKYLRKINS